MHDRVRSRDTPLSINAMQINLLIKQKKYM